MTPYASGKRWTLYRADYRETLAACEGAADLVLTSPPYCDARTYGAAVSWGMADYAALGDVVFAALRPGGACLLNVDAPVREWRPGFGSERGFHPWRIMLDWAERVGFRVPDRLAFGRLGARGEYRGRFRNDWEPLLWFEKPGGVPFLDKRVLAIASPTRWAGKRAINRKADGSFYERNASGWAVENTATNRGTLWDYGNQGNGNTGAADIEAENHPARWPYVLAEDIVRCFCPPAGLACDPFLGAGTSAVAALSSGRRFLGGDAGDRDATPDRGLDGVPWVEVAARVVRARERQVPLFGAAS